MKKIVYNRFGGTEVLEIKEVPVPQGEIVVKVKAASINPLDWKLWQGEMKLMSGRKFPKSVGIDFSGIVEKGNGSFQKGDEVFGMTEIFKGGALAEFIAVRETDTFRKPKTISFEEAASLPVAGSAALQLFEKSFRVQPGMELLINGAGGGIGPFAIQLAKKAGAIVTAIVGPNATDLAKSLKSDFVIDYTKQNILDMGKTFDAIIDLSGKISFHSAKSILKKRGVFINTLPAPMEMLRSVLSGGRYKVLVLKPSVKYLEQLASSSFNITVSRRYRFEEYRQAYDEMKKGGIPGKVVFVIN